MKALKFFIAMLALGGDGALASQTYTLVQGIDKFDGSAAAWGLLETNGFVVADPACKQIFEPYLDTSLPPFITTDSAWETYQVLLAAGVRQLESANHPDPNFFTNAIELGMPGRAMASGLDFFVASPELRSPAAVRALRQAAGAKVEPAAENLNDSLQSNSLAAKSLRLLASLQMPVPGEPAPPFRSQAWADEQLWAQLGAWIELNHPCQPLPGPPEVLEPADDAPKKGAVAPYPVFFAGLAQLARDTAAAMEKAGMDEPFDARAVAQKLLDGIFIAQGLEARAGGDAVKSSAVEIQFNEFAGRYMETHHAGGRDNSIAAQQMLKDFEAVARRWLGGTVPAEEDRAVLQSFFDERVTPPRLIREFAAICDKLAVLARKQVDGSPLTKGDQDWIAGYGKTLARLHFFPVNSAIGADDDSPIIRRLGANTAGASVLWAGLGHPETLYIILPADGRLQLFRGAVLAYREFLRPGSDALDDKSWRDKVQSGDAPAPPAFTASFRAEKSAADLLESLAAEAADPQGFRNIQESLEALQSRVNDADLPALIGALEKTDGAFSGSPLTGGIASAIAKLNWEPSREKLLALIEKDDGVHAAAVASILLQRPEWLDPAWLCASFDHSPTRTRRVYALLLGRLKPTAQTCAALAQALSDDAPGVRWQAALALSAAAWNAAQKIPPLVDRLSDTNEFVAAAAARGLGKIESAGVAPVLFANLQQRLAAPQAGTAAFQEQYEAVQDNLLGNINGRSNPFDPDNLLGRAQMARMRRFAPDFRRDQFTAVTALIESLGNLHYHPAEDTILGLLGGRNANAAAKALRQLAPEKLARRLISIASDKNAPPQARDDALSLLADAAGASPVADLVPLLDDQTVVPGNRMMPGREWRICDRAAVTLAALMGRTVRLVPTMPADLRDLQIEQVRQWLKSAY